MQVLNRHVIPVALPAASLENGRQVATVTGGFLNVTVSEGTVSFTTSDGASTARVIEPDIEMCNGYIHIIDTILLPGDRPLNGTLVPDGAVLDANGSEAAAAPVQVTEGGLPAPLIPHVSGITPNENDVYSVCSGRWAPLEFSGPEPCGIRVRPSGVVNVGELLYLKFFMLY
jgi:hypothetical protein